MLTLLRTFIRKHSSLEIGTPFFHNGIVQWLSIGIVLLNLALWGALAFFVRPQDFLIKFHFNAFFGVDIFSQWWHVFILPAIGLVFFALNLFLAYWFYFFKERIAAYIVLLTSFLFHASIIIASIAIILVNR